MRFIDEKGRLLGIINYMDLAILLVAISLVAGFVVLRGDEPTENNLKEVVEENQEMTIKYFIGGVKDISVQSVKIGDPFRSVATGAVIGEVTDMQVEQATMTTTDDKGNVIESEIPDRYNITLTIKSSGIVSNEEIRAKGSVIYIGQSTLIQSKMIKFLAIIYGIEY